jgi:hypothetical protein
VHVGEDVPVDRGLKPVSRAGSPRPGERPGRPGR